MADHNALDEAACEARIARLRLLARVFWNVLDREALGSLDFGAFDGTDGAAARAKEAALRNRERALADEEEARRLRVEYTSLFASPRLEAPLPYESLYVSGGGLLMQDARDEALRAYDRNGFAEREGNEPEDHLSTELRFLAFLYGRALSAQKEGRARERDEALSTAASFKEGHLDRWAPLFCGRALQAAESDFYRGSLALLEPCLRERL